MAGQGAAAEGAPIPVTIIGGYLGAGKTTLVNHLLRNAGGRRLAVMVNDFGALPIDADLIEGERDGNLLSLAGGCVCCSYGSDLVDALMDLPTLIERPDRILIEASGVAIPGNIAGAVSLIAHCRLDAVVVLADAENLERQLGDRFMADTVERQLADAELVLVSKTDLVGTDALRGVRERVSEHAATATVLHMAPGDVPVEVVLDFVAPDTTVRTPGQPTATDASDHLDGLWTAHWHLHGPVDAAALARTLANGGVLRAKGFLDAADGVRKAVQVVGRRAEVTDAPEGASTGLVCIAIEGQVDVVAINALLGVSPHLDDGHHDGAHHHGLRHHDS